MTNAPPIYKKHPGARQPRTSMTRDSGGNRVRLEKKVRYTIKGRIFLIHAHDDEGGSWPIRAEGQEEGARHDRADDWKRVHKQGPCTANHVVQRREREVRNFVMPGRSERKTKLQHGE